MTVITRAPTDLVVAMSDGIHIRFAGVLLKSVPPYVGDRAGKPGIHPPTMPGVTVHEQLTTKVTDDLGTEYARTGGQVAGDGTEWDATWVFTPAPPSEARRLRFEFSVDGVPTGKSCELDLQTN
ncbi:hypothetical protein GCM10027404_33320 [Arthrobacter tumbae]|nr:hypothetical protein [Arthrobacter tumbae]